MKPETSVKSISGESDCDKKKDDVTEEVMLAEKLHIEGTLRYFTTLKTQGVKYWKLMQIYKGVWQFTEVFTKVCSLGILSYTKKA